MRCVLKDTTQCIAHTGMYWVTPRIAPMVHELSAALTNRAIQFIMNVYGKNAMLVTKKGQRTYKFSILFLLMGVFLFHSKPFYIGGNNR